MSGYSFSVVTCVGACMNSAIFSGSMRPLSISSDTAEDVPSRPTSLRAWRMVPSRPDSSTSVCAMASLATCSVPDSWSITPELSSIR